MFKNCSKLLQRLTILLGVTPNYSGELFFPIIPTSLVFVIVKFDSVGGTCNESRYHIIVSALELGFQMFLSLCFGIFIPFSNCFQLESAKYILRAFLGIANWLKRETTHIVSSLLWVVRLPRCLPKARRLFNVVYLVHLSFAEVKSTRTIQLFFIEASTSG